MIFASINIKFKPLQNIFTTNHSFVFLLDRLLLTRHIPRKIIRLIELFYDDTSTQDLYKGKLRRHITKGAGVKQYFSTLSCVINNIKKKVTAHENIGI